MYQPTGLDKSAVYNEYINVCHNVRTLPWEIHCFKERGIILLVHQNCLVACENINQEFIIWIFTLTWKHLVLFLVLDWTDKLSCHRLFPASNLEVLLGNYYMFYNGGRRQKWLDHMKQYNTWSDVQTWLDQIKQYNTWAFCATKLSLCFIEVLHKKSSVLKVNGVQVSCL